MELLDTNPQLKAAVIGEEVRLEPTEETITYLKNCLKVEKKVLKIIHHYIHQK